MALGDKVEELQRTAAILEERLDNGLKLLDRMSGDHGDAVRQLTDLRREYEREIALVKREIEELRKWKDVQERASEELTRRLWTFGPSIVGAVISVLGAAAVAYLIARR